MEKKSPLILSLAHKDEILNASQALHRTGLDNFVMYIIFNNGSRFVLSNVFHILESYYAEKLYREDFSFRPEIISDKEYYICDKTKSVSDKLKASLEERFGVHRAYYIIRESAECKFVFGAIKNKRIHDHDFLYKNSIKDFENFCLNFATNFTEIIKSYNQDYKSSFILNNPKLLSAIIKGDFFEENLTDREIDCLWHASLGMSAKEAARALKISPATAETHYKNIRKKLNCSTMIEAVVVGIQKGIVGNLYNLQPNKKCIQNLKKLIPAETSLDMFNSD